MTIQSGQNI